MKVEGIHQGSLISTMLNKQSSSQAPQDSKENVNKEQAAANMESSVNVSLNITLPRQTLDTIERIGSVTDFLNSTAKNIRETDSSLKLSADIVSRMKDDLSRIVKNYPPFPIESSERRDILRSYLSLRKEIDRMTVPTPPAPVYERMGNLWGNLFTGSSGKIQTPDLTETSGDLAVKEALSSVTLIGDSILQTRTALGASI